MYTGSIGLVQNVQSHQRVNIFDLALNLRIIIIIIATIVAADARHLFQGVTNISSSQVIYIHRSKN